MTSHESYLGISFIETANEQSFYSSHYTFDQPAFYPGTIFGLSIIQNPDITYYERSIYHMLDFLGDIGGLSDALYIIAAVFTGLI